MYPVRCGVIALYTLWAVGLEASAQPIRIVPVDPHGYLGVQVGPAERGGTGVVVQEVTPDSPAFKSGLQKGDRIVKISNQEVQNVDGFITALMARKRGDKLVLDTLREGKEQQLTITLGEWPTLEVLAPPDPLGVRRISYLGVQTQPLTLELQKRLNVEAETGVVVTDVVSNSPAAKAGLQRDDVIMAFNDRPVKAPTDLQDAVQNAGPGKEVTLQIVRGKEKLSVKATLQEAPFGFFLAPGRVQPPIVESTPTGDPAQRIRDLERRIDGLEKRLRELEKK